MNLLVPTPCDKHNVTPTKIGVHASFHKHGV